MIAKNIDIDGDFENMTKDEEISQTPKYFRENNKVSIFRKRYNTLKFFEITVFSKEFSQRLVIAIKCFRKNSYTRISKSFQRTFLCDVNKSK